MLDLRFIKENLDAVKKNIADRNMTCDAEKVVELYDKRTKLTTDLQSMQKLRNENAAKMKGKIEASLREQLIEEGKDLKQKIAVIEAELSETEEQLSEEAKKIPNMAHPEAPVGKLDSDNLEIKQVGEIRKFDFSPKDHVQIGLDLDLIDFDAATKVSGNKFYYLPGSLRP